MRLSAKWCGGGGGFDFRKFISQANRDFLIIYVVTIFEFVSDEVSCMYLFRCVIVSIFVGANVSCISPDKNIV